MTEIGPRLLDAYSGQGGASAGYAAAGFDVTAVDLFDQPRHPGQFIQAEALQYLREHGREYDLIHASPPCQRFTSMRHAPGAKQHPDLIGPTRDLLERIGVPWVIENVPYAPLINPVVLCGSMFGLGVDGYQLRRHRLFESSVPLAAPGPCNHHGKVIGVYGQHVRCRSAAHGWRGGRDFPGVDKLELAGQAMGIDWMSWPGISQAIPPVFSEWVGRQLRARLETAAA